MKRTNCLLRADCSPEIGFGHLQRAIGLQQELRRNGYSTKILMRSFDVPRESVVPRLKAAQVDELRDEDEFISILSSTPPAYIFLDLRERAEYETLAERLCSVFRERGRDLRTVCFDGFYPEKVPFDLVVAPFFVPSNPKAAFPSLCGPKYFIVREELEKVLEHKTEIDFENPRKILITMGGSDPSNASALIVEALCSRFPELVFRVVLGPGFSEAQCRKIRAFSEIRANLCCIESPRDLAEHFLWADLAVTSGGLTKYETALFGIPSLIFAQNEQEETLAREFGTLGSSTFMGRASHIDPAALERNLRGFLSHPERMRKFSRNGKAIVDAQGSKRLIDYVEEKLP